MLVCGYGVTHVGHKRSNNEDIFLIDEKLGLYLVCDGMGGHVGGEVASRTAANVMTRHLHSNLDVIRQGTNDELDHMLEEAVQAACAQVYALSRSNPKLAGMGTTLTGLLIRGRRGFVVHVGDSRLYMQRGGRIHRLTEDHTYYDELIRLGRLTPEQASEFAQAQALTRAIGIQPSVVVDHLQFDVLRNDTFVLCSDGLTNYLEDNEEMKGLVDQSDAENLAGLLVAFALDRGGRDNVTVLVVDVRPDAAHTFSEERFESEVTFRTQTLKDVALFQHLTMVERVGLLGYVKVYDYPAGAAVVREGDVGEHIHVVLDGVLAVEVAGKSVAALKYGDHFGEMSLLTRRPRSATVRAHGPARIMSIGQHDFLTIVQQQPEVGARLLWNLAQVLAIRLDERPESSMPRGTDPGRILSVRPKLAGCASPIPHPPTDPGICAPPDFFPC